MKKIYSFLFAFICVALMANRVFSQSVNQGPIPYDPTPVPKDLLNDPRNTIPATEPVVSSSAKSLPFFLDDFSVSANWTKTGTGAASTVWNVSSTGGSIPAAYKLPPSFGSFG